MAFLKGLTLGGAVAVTVALLGNSSPPAAPVDPAVQVLARENRALRAAAGVSIGRLVTILGEAEARQAELADLDRKFRVLGGSETATLVEKVRMVSDNAEVAALMERSRERLAQLERENAVLRARLAGRHQQLTEVTVDELNRAVPLLPPKLMLSVSGFDRDGVMANFGDTSRFLVVGRMVEMAVDGLDCFLVLKEVRRREALFDFGCSV